MMDILFHAYHVVHKKDIYADHTCKVFFRDIQYM